MKKWKVVVAGAGRAGEDLAVGGIRIGGRYADLSCVHLAAIADVDEARARTIAGKNGIPGVYSDIATMLDKEKPDVMFIMTPLQEHFAHAMMCIERGVHFVLEKPATQTVGELEQIREWAERAKVKGMVSHNYKFLPGFVDAWKWYKEGLLGDIVHIDRVWMSPPQEDRMERVDGWWHHIPGGRMADGMPHHLYVAYPFVGEMELQHVSVKKLSKDRPWSACDEADIVLSSAKGYVNIRMSTNQQSWPEGKRGLTYYVVLYGTHRNAIIYQQEAQLLMPGMDWKIRRAKEVIAKAAKEKLARFLNKPVEQGIRGGHNVMYNRFFQYLEGKIENPVPWDEAIHVMKMTEQIGAAMQTQIDALNRKSAPIPEKATS
jgi:predicted dehydrogenase